MTDLSNKKILIAGSSSGIGEETARLLARCGAYVILAARREQLLEKICSELETKHKAYYKADFSDIGSIEPLISTITEQHGRLDGLVYAAGTSRDDCPLRLLTPEKIISTFNTNFFGFVECVRQVTKRSNYNKGFRIVAVSSVASMFGEKAHLAYCASKSAMDSAVRCIAKELADKGVCINSVAPSMVNTDMYKDFIEQGGDKSENGRRSMARQYLGVAEKTDIANAIAFLISPEAKHITGITLPVDGGFSTS